MVVRRAYWAIVLWGVGWAQRYCPVDRAFLRPFPPAVSWREALTDTLWVPVVFHVISQDSAGWLPAYRLGDQLAALNRDYKAAAIQFYLPRYGPQGEPTCGLTWHVSPLGRHDWTTEEDTLKKLCLWPPDSFVNIWIVDEMVLSTVGYARALGDTAGIPGIVLVKSVVGNRTGVARPFDWGRTAVHEMGHVLSLLHPFEGGCVGTTPQTCAMEGDEICDTPPQRQPAFGCPPLTTNTCTEIPTDLPDPVDNFMGYVDDSCMVRFTPEQTQRMRLYLQGIGGTLISPINQQRRGWGSLADSACGVVLGLPKPAPSPLRFWREGTLWRLEGPEPIGWEVWDAWGRKITEGTTRSFDEQVLPAGLYVLRVHTPAGLYTIRWYRL
ncbi:MAG: hypothetical protein KatS3mg026_0843 [Bacteroidia bacterium]|nr:MAG: hypothetical protein KatS3mg026_0843 [Bacteroidia bacterium]